MKTLNLGILAHVDAGKTSLTERLLHAAGVIETMGSVDGGSTQTDSMALERQRGITIKSAVVSFLIDDVTVNLIDTPGHPDFIAEVERVLSVLDGAVLVISAVEGVQAQTRVLMRTLTRLRIPTLIFVNKIDRRGAQHGPMVRSIADQLGLSTIAMSSVDALGTRGASSTPYATSNPDFLAAMVDALAGHTPSLLAAYVDDRETVSEHRIRAELAAQSRQALVHPVFFGSAITGAGVDSLIGALTDLLPAGVGDAEAETSGTVFKVERGPARELVAYVRMFAGVVHIRDRLHYGRDRDGKVTAIRVFEQGSDIQSPAVAAGRIAKLYGLRDIQIGDGFGVSPTTSPAHHFAPPSLETVVEPVHAADRGLLHSALTQLAEQDPLINLRPGHDQREIFVSLYGEVQKEVIESTLADEFDIAVAFRETTTICIERPVGTGAAFEIIATEPNPFLATVGLRIDPAPVNAGVKFRLEVELGSMPYSFFTAIEQSVDETLQQGLRGWRVADCAVTLTHTGYYARQSHAHGTFDKSMSSTAGDFRHLTPLVLMAALTQAGTTVLEPVHRFSLEIPDHALSPVLLALSRLRAVPQPPTRRGVTWLLAGDIPAAEVHTLTTQLPALTRGEGVLESAFDRYEPVTGAIPARPRTDANPLNRKEYLLGVDRRMVGPER